MIQTTLTRRTPKIIFLRGLVGSPRYLAATPPISIFQWMHTRPIDWFISPSRKQSLVALFRTLPRGRWWGKKWDFCSILPIYRRNPPLRYLPTASGICSVCWMSFTPIQAFNLWCIWKWERNHRHHHRSQHIRISRPLLRWLLNNSEAIPGEAVFRDASPEGRSVVFASKDGWRSWSRFVLVSWKIDELMKNWLITWDKYVIPALTMGTKN